LPTLVKGPGVSIKIGLSGETSEECRSISEFADGGKIAAAESKRTLYERAVRDAQFHSIPVQGPFAKCLRVVKGNGMRSVCEASNA
jgi:hypothetical protein